MSFQKEFNFELPKGYQDEHGKLHKKGIMRLATAADEILPLKDPRVHQNPSYLQIILLSRVITKLGDLQIIDTSVIESLFSSDFAFLIEFYQRINQGDVIIDTICPKCGHNFKTSLETSV